MQSKSSSRSIPKWSAVTNARRRLLPRKAERTERGTDARSGTTSSLASLRSASPVSMGGGVDRGRSCLKQTFTSHLRNGLNWSDADAAVLWLRVAALPLSRPRSCRSGSSASTVIRHRQSFLTSSVNIPRLRRAHGSAPPLAQLHPPITRSCISAPTNRSERYHPRHQSARRHRR